jgi:hypothetical protein
MLRTLHGMRCFANIRPIVLYAVLRTLYAVPQTLRGALALYMRCTNIICGALDIICAVSNIIHGPLSIVGYVVLRTLYEIRRYSCPGILLRGSYARGLL